VVVVVVVWEVVVWEVDASTTRGGAMDVVSCLSAFEEWGGVK